ncbi:hypothetical protein ROG8370_02607 [Roseovarius gaetbuli]|uniref:Alcohol dehydrogenase-like N-terminal domain-containing protein n=1 Tax=Roseovarius gaetbuli TaxID=1356575 RepID=A0A1X6ZRN8_9RHOB|nr:hypothetical protein ROG8370_02607 [Roseovarius gaetbuli]
MMDANRCAYRLTQENLHAFFHAGIVIGGRHRNLRFHLKGPEDLGVETLKLKAPGTGDLVVDVAHSGISTGTEKLFWSGKMPPFPGMGCPLVPGYEAAGEVVEAAPGTGYRVGDHVFVPGADCFADAFGLFGGASQRLVTKAERVTRITARSMTPRAIPRFSTP